jgi:hypothetical protein
MIVKTGKVIPLDYRTVGRALATRAELAHKPLAKGFGGNLNN